MTAWCIGGRPRSRRPREAVVAGRAPAPSLRRRLPVGLQAPHPASGLEARRPLASDPVAVERAGRRGPDKRSPRGRRGQAASCRIAVCAAGRIRVGSAPPSGARTPGSIAPAGTNGRCERNDARRRPCGRLGEVRTEPGVALAAGPMMARRRCRLGVRADRCASRTRRDAPERGLAPTGARGRLKPRLPPVTARPATGCGMGRNG